MEPRTVAALLTLGVLMLRNMTWVAMAHNDDFTELDDFDTAHNYIEAARATQKHQTYIQENTNTNETSTAYNKSSDDFKIDDDTYGMLEESKNKADKNRLHVEEEFLNRKHTAHAETAAQHRDKRQDIGDGPNCIVTNQTFIGRTFSNRSFNNCVFTNCNFNNCTFENCTFTEATFTNCNFPSCTFINSSFINCAFTNCNFTNCSFNNRPFINCTYTNVNFAPPFPHT